jgi:nucleoside-diphosphate-sugar epimerase
LQYPHEFPVREESEKRFTGVYSRNKWECEARLLEVRARSGLTVVFPRMPMIFGPGFYHEPSMMLLFRLIRRGLPVPVTAAPDAPWASVASADAAYGIRLCGEAAGADGEAFNLAAPDAPPCQEALRELIGRVGSRSRVVLMPLPLTDWFVDLIERYEEWSPTPAELVRFALVGGEYSIAKARRVLGYEPRYSAVDAMESAYRSLYS